MRRTLLAITILVSTSTLAQAQSRSADPDSESLGVVTFAAGSARVRDAALDRVEEIARWHRAHPTSLLIIEGHASRSGSRSGNLAISQKRTDAIRNALVSAGADRSRMVLVAHGDTRAAAGGGAPRVVIKGTGVSDIALAQRMPRLGGEDTRAARTAPATQRRDSSTPVGRGNTIVIVGAGGGAATTSAVTGADTNAGIAGRTSGGTGTSALTGIGFDPTDGAEEWAGISGLGGSIGPFALGDSSFNDGAGSRANTTNAPTNTPGTTTTPATAPATTRGPGTTGIGTTAFPSGTSGVGQPGMGATGPATGATGGR